MKQERIELSQRERKRLQAPHEVEQGHLSQVEAAGRAPAADAVARNFLTSNGTPAYDGVGFGKVERTRCAGNSSASPLRSASPMGGADRGGARQVLES